MGHLLRKIVRQTLNSETILALTLLNYMQMQVAFVYRKSVTRVNRYSVADFFRIKLRISKFIRKHKNTFIVFLCKRGVGKCNFPATTNTFSE